MGVGVKRGRRRGRDEVEGRTTEEVVAGRDVGDDDTVLASGGDEAVDGPGRAARVVAV